jgi:tetratricopeptide (TPR) repeat protein
MTWSPDGQQLASAAGDGTIRIWDASSGYQLSDTPASRRALARQLAGQGVYDEALAILQGSCAAPPNRDELEQIASIHLLRAEECQQTERYAEAFQDYTKALELQPKSSRVYTSRGLVLAQLERWEEALSDWAKAIELDPDNVHGCRHAAHVHRIGLFTRLEKWDEALKEYDKWLEVHPDWSGIYARRGVMLSQLKRYDDALRDWAKAIELDPDNTHGCRGASHGNRIGVLERLKKWDEALKEYDKWLEVNPDWSMIYTQRGLMLSQLKRYDDALRDWAKAIELDPDNTHGCRGASHGNRIGVYADLGQWDKAMAECEEAFKVKGNAKNAFLWHISALVNLSMGRRDEYRTRCAALLELCRGFQNLRAGAANCAAWTCSLAPDAVSDLPTVVRFARRAAEKDPKSLSYVNTLGAALYRAGQFKEAAGCLEQIDGLAEGADSDERSSPAYGWYFLAMAHRRLGNQQDAAKWLNKAIDWTDRALEEHNRQGGKSLPWNRRATLELLRQEAEGLLKPAAETKEPKPQSNEEPTRSSEHTPSATRHS